MPNLISFGYDFNTQQNLKYAFDAIQDIIDNLSICCHLSLSGVKFNTTQSIMGAPGWYIILHNNTAAYVGQAKNLRERTTGNGAIDNYYMGTFTSRNLTKKQWNLQGTLR